MTTNNVQLRREAIDSILQLKREQNDYWMSIRNTALFATTQFREVNTALKIEATQGEEKQ